MVAAYVFRTRFEYRRLRTARFVTFSRSNEKKKKTEKRLAGKKRRNQIRAHHVQTPRFGTRLSTRTAGFERGTVCTTR